ncbi:hypothetical protein B9Z55_007969 [Caenorhabditis nigoni]|nr:hypothetical protein B9Z55_007969 [Caenorhabditis nigoni]
MKLFFSSILFIAVVVSSKAAVDPDRPDFLKKLNEVRREIAREFHVANMNQLVWSPGIAREVADSDSELDLDYRRFELKSLNDTEEVFEKMKELAREAEESKGKGEYKNGLLEALNPELTEIGCSLREGFSGYVCCLSSSEELVLWKFDSSEGPATFCASTQYPINDLCVDSCNMFHLASLINEVRKKFAERYNVSIMHELRPDDVRGLETYSLDATPYHSMTIDICDYTIAEIESEIDEFVAMSETERSEYLKKPGWKLAELIFPTTDVFMCDFLKSDNHKLCFVGPRVSNYLWNPNPNHLNAPRTGCEEGFESFRDLCTFSIAGYRDFVLTNVNLYRMTVAKYHNIGNMLQLSWSKELEEISNSNESKFESMPDFQVKWRYGKGVGEDSNLFKWFFISLAKWTAYDTTKQDEFINQNSSTSLEFLEFLNPVQSQIGCSLNKVGIFDYMLTCVFGPHGHFERLEKQPKAIPGSTCPNDFHVKDGFCIRLGDSQEFLVDLNDFRRSHSEKNEIPKMQKIVWDKSLVKIAEKTDWSESQDPVVKDYRYVLLNDYRDIKKRLEKEILKLDTFSESELDEAFQFMSKTSLGLSELLDPQRNIIGCAYKDQRIAPGLLCILGPVQKDVKSPPKQKTTLPKKPEKTLTKKPESPAPESDESKTTRQPMSNFWSILFLLLASRIF